MRKSEELGVKAEWYEKPGSAEHVLIVGEMNEPQPLPGEVRIQVAFSGVNPGDVKNARTRSAGQRPPSPSIPLEKINRRDCE